MLFLDGVYVERPDGSVRFHWVKAASGTELTRLTQMLARRIGRHLERQGLLERAATWPATASRPGRWNNSSVHRSPI